MHQRRKKRRPHRTNRVEIERKSGGFGFSIVGQMPCIISSGPNELIKPGDCLLSVQDVSNNGPEINVTKMTHEQVVDLIANASNKIRLAVAERFYRDESSSDEDAYAMSPINALSATRPYLTSKIPRSLFQSANVVQCQNVSNVSAMIRSFNIESPSSFSSSGALMYRVVVGYLGTIDMQQVTSNSHSQNVKSCIRKLRQEKRNPTVILMTILPSSLSLKNAQNVVLASFPASRICFVGTNSDTECRYFGLVTSTCYSDGGLICDSAELLSPHPDVSFSTHVFVVDNKIVEHPLHTNTSDAFEIACTRDQVTGRCLEFPYNSKYVVDLLTSMFLHREKNPAPFVRAVNVDQRRAHRQRRGFEERRRAHVSSPPSSSHSEVTTTSSNSDSGIGFHNDCTNVSDRIVVVNFPGNPVNEPKRSDPSVRPAAILHEVPEVSASNPLYEAIFPKFQQTTHPAFQERPVDVPEFMLSYARSTIEDVKRKMGTAKSVDDLASSKPNQTDESKKKMQASLDNLMSGSDGFAVPRPKKLKRPTTLKAKHSDTQSERSKRMSTDKLTSYKLSPKVFGLPRPISQSFENLSSSVKGTVKSKKGEEEGDNWGSLRELRLPEKMKPRLKREDVTSEPDLRRDELNGYSTTQPFHRRNQPSFSSVSSARPPVRRSVRPSSVAGSENDICNDISSSYEPTGALSWSTSFEKMLTDSVGIQAFAQFLKKEISAENIYFWTACERYRQLSDAERPPQAQAIFKKYLSDDASDPVNVDSRARSIAHEKLEGAERELFDKAQKQIFNLMKFDSYQRFIKSDVYKQCLEAEKKRLKVPFLSDGLDPELQTNLKPFNSGSTLKKSLSNADDKRRKSLLPWSRKNRSASKERLNEFCSRLEVKEKIQRSGSKGSINDLHSSRSSLTSFDSAIFRNGVVDSDDRTTLCRIHFPDGSTTVAQLKDEPVDVFISRQLEKRGMKFHYFEVFEQLGSSKPIDPSLSALTLTKKDVRVEHRVLFKLDLPNKKVISVKSKANKILSDVLHPILTRYNFKLEEMKVFIKDKEVAVDTSVPVTEVEQERLIILSYFCDDAPKAPRSEKSAMSSENPHTLDEITNKVFNELLQGKHILTRKKADVVSVKSEDLSSDVSSCDKKNYIPFQAQGMAINKAIKPIRPVVHVKTEEANVDIKKPLITKLIPGANIQTSSQTHGEELLEEIKRAQRARLEDQRGTEINFDLPEFLKRSKEHAQRQAFKPQPAPRHSIMNSKLQATSVINRVHNIESRLEPPQRHLPYDSDTYEIYNGDTTMIIMHHPEKSRPESISESADLNVSFKSASSNNSNVYQELDESSDDGRGFNPPPLPPKPKVLPLKPLNWGQAASNPSPTKSDATFPTLI